ncbi:hypothetical protein VNO78_13090 [Psophocarpus tetragonolobus]|uniref:Uncharacterized protein n=1 Tax=Psophocarpus tetragonolobus TaxID=3891 RepID=A0AAN9SX17_PSOTE
MEEEGTNGKLLLVRVGHEFVVVERSIPCGGLRGYLLVLTMISSDGDNGDHSFTCKDLDVRVCNRQRNRESALFYENGPSKLADMSLVSNEYAWEKVSNLL